MIAILVACQFFLGLVAHQHKPSDFFGFKIGMPAAAALKIAGKNPHTLESVPLREGQRVLSDTISIASCGLAMRRSLGFDSSGKLSAVGFTYKTIPEDIDSTRECAYQWLAKTYGPPTTESVRDSTKQEVWRLGREDQITLEARAYNSHDYFVLIYYYKVPAQSLAE